MSDYLWDRKGEPDAEVARLEALLGAFAHEPRRLELPAEAAVSPAVRPWRLLPFMPRRFAPAALAAAVVLLVVSVLAASVFLRSRAVTEGGRAAAPESARPKGEAPGAERTTPREVEQSMLEPPPGAGGVKDLTPSPTFKVKDGPAAVETPTRVVHRRKDLQLAAVPSRRQRLPAVAALTGEGLTLEQMSTPAGASSLVESARLLTKEQLVYALRLTGAKLRDVRQRAQGTTK